jgi:tetratricopeptide (TPR) repeat protein
MDRAWINLGLTLGMMEKYDEALRAFEKAVRPAESTLQSGAL